MICLITKMLTFVAYCLSDTLLVLRKYMFCFKLKIGIQNVVLLVPIVIVYGFCLFFYGICLELFTVSFLLLFKYLHKSLSCGYAF